MTDRKVAIPDAFGDEGFISFNPGIKLSLTDTLAALRQTSCDDPLNKIKSLLEVVQLRAEDPSSVEALPAILSLHESLVLHYEPEPPPPFVAVEPAETPEPAPDSGIADSAVEQLFYAAKRISELHPAEALSALLGALPAHTVNFMRATIYDLMGACSKGKISGSLNPEQMELLIATLGKEVADVKVQENFNHLPDLRGLLDLFTALGAEAEWSAPILLELYALKTDTEMMHIARALGSVCSRNPAKVSGIFFQHLEHGGVLAQESALQGLRALGPALKPLLPYLLTLFRSLAEELEAEEIRYDDGTPIQSDPFLLFEDFCWLLVETDSCQCLPVLKTIRQTTKNIMIKAVCNRVDANAERHSQHAA